ncbi:MAG: sigma factor [Candidatus Binataceae bacterium]
MDREEAQKFEQSLLGWLDDAYNLARWLLRDDQDAQDAVQEGFMRAMRFASGFRGGDRRAWLLTIVRNVCYTQLSRRTAASNVVFDEEQHQGAAGPATDPQAAAFSRVDREALIGASRGAAGRVPRGDLDARDGRTVVKGNRRRRRRADWHRDVAPGAGARATAPRAQRQIS